MGNLRNQGATEGHILATGQGECLFSLVQLPAEDVCFVHSGSFAPKRLFHLERQMIIKRTQISWFGIDSAQASV